MISSFIGERRTAAVMSVSIQPGAMALTWMLCGGRGVMRILVLLYIYFDAVEKARENHRDHRR